MSLKKQNNVSSIMLGSEKSKVWLLEDIIMLQIEKLKKINGPNNRQ